MREAESRMGIALLDAFLIDARVALEVLETLLEQELNGTALSSIEAKAQAMKSVLRNIGESYIAETAQRLTTSARAKDATEVASLLPDFVSALQEVVEQETERLQKQSHKGSTSEHEDDTELLHSLLETLASACDAFDIDEADDILSRMSSEEWSEATTELVKELSMYIFRGDFKQSATLARQAITSITLTM